MPNGVGTSSLASAVSAPTNLTQYGRDWTQAMWHLHPSQSIFASTLCSSYVPFSEHSMTAACHTILPFTRLTGSKWESWIRPRNSHFHEHHVLYAPSSPFPYPGILWRFALNFWSLLVSLGDNGKRGGLFLSQIYYISFTHQLRAILASEPVWPIL